MDGGALRRIQEDIFGVAISKAEHISYKGHDR
jgi:hypothetical protein